MAFIENSLAVGLKCLFISIYQDLMAILKPASFSLCLAACLFYGSLSLARAESPLKPLPPQDLVPHKALYDVKMLSGKSGSQMINISGKMFYEWKPSCEGWITNHRFSLNYDYADSPTLNVSSDFSTFETFDGKTLNFSSRRKRDGEIYEELRGKALMNGPDGSGSADYTMPENLSYALDKGTLFPAGHTMKLLQQAKSGNKFYTARIFDGSDSEGAVDITSFISTKDQPAQSNLKKNNSFKPASTGPVDSSLLTTPSWKVRMAFFPVKKKESASDYELSMVFHENGIISDMVIEYADFSVSQKLVALEKIAPANCKN